MEEDALVMLIVGEDNETLKDEIKVEVVENEVKLEPLDYCETNLDIKTEDDNFGYEDDLHTEDIDKILETAYKFGQYLPVSQPVTQKKGKKKQKKAQSIPSKQKKDKENQELLYNAMKKVEKDDSEDEFVIGNGYSSDDEEFFTRSKSVLLKRMKNDKLSSRRYLSVKSYVDRLRKKNPMYLDEEVLIQKIATVMKKLKSPTLENYFTIKDDKFGCVECDYVGSLEANVRSHYRSNHGPFYVVCFACGLEYRNLSGLLKHEIRCRSPDADIVLKARTLALTRRGRSRPYMLKKLTRKERNERHKKKMLKIKCSYCIKVFASKDSLNSHERLHRGERPYMCDQCENSYTSLVVLRRHIKTRHQDNYVECDHCGRRFKLKHHLIVHLATHLPQYKYECIHKGCKQRFSQRTSMQYHYDRVHLKKPIPIACKFCTKRFRHMHQLKVHMKQKHGLDMYSKHMLYRKIPKMSNLKLKNAIAIFNGNTKEINSN